MVQIYQAGSINTNGLTVPNLYVQVVPPAVVINGVPSDIMGVVGTAQFGPVGTPVICSSVAQYNQTFGAVQNRTYDAGTVVAVATMQGAQSFKVVRVTDGTDTYASNSIGSGACTLTAKYTGSLGNQITATIAQGSANNTIKLIVGMPNVTPEVYDNITNSATTATTWAAVANAVTNGSSALRGPSQIITATANGSNAAVTPGTTYIFTGGTDGVASCNAATLIGQDTTTSGTGTRTGMYALRGQGCFVGVLADCTSYSYWTTIEALALSEGIYFVQNGPAGETIASAAANKAASGADTYSLKLMLGDYCYFQDPYNGVLRLVAPNGFAAGLLAALSPQLSTLNKQLLGIAGTQRTGAPGTQQSQTYSYAELEALAAAQLDVICNPAPGGNYYAVRYGHNASSNAAVHGDNYTRLTNYVATSLYTAMGQFVGMPITVGLFNQVSAAVTNFLQNMYQQNLLGTTTGAVPYGVVCNLTNNPFTRTSLGYLQCDVQITYMAITEFLIANIQGGQTVSVTIGQSTSSPTNLINA